MVNKGFEFEGKYIRQMKNIDLKNYENWTPIEIYGSGNYFYGYYDGNGHVINNIYITTNNNNALFGVVGGRITNLGIENGKIAGENAAGIVYSSIGKDSIILNCYNNAIIKGKRAGGIADTFNGRIINCWNTGDLIGDIVGGIVSYNSQSAEYCYSNQTLFGRNFIWV